MNSTLLDAYNSAKKFFISRDFDGANAIIQKIQPLIKTEITDKNRLIPKLNVRYSIIVAVHQGFDSLKALLEDLEPYLFRQDYELIVINNTCQPAPNTIQSLITEHSIIDIGFNYGCSGGRNVGAELAQGHYILFLDDDGRLACGSIEALIHCIEKNHSVACRGKVIPKDEIGISGGHYDKGPKVNISPPDAEGISIWNRKVFLEYGGFDPLLAGHEGLALCAKMHRDKHLHSFLYTPHATLRHNFSDDEEKNKIKLKLHATNREYLEHIGINHRKLKKQFLRRAFFRIFYRFK
jgi:GT2 family glycosyltransferase